MQDTKQEYIIKCSSDDYTDLMAFLKEHNIHKGQMTIRTYLAGTSMNGTSSDIIQDIFATKEELLLLKISFSIVMLK